MIIIGSWLISKFGQVSCWFRLLTHVRCQSRLVGFKHFLGLDDIHGAGLVYWPRLGASHIGLGL